MEMENKKLDLVIKAIIEAREITPKGWPVKVYITDDNGLDTLNPEEFEKILVKLQVDEKVIKIESFPYCWWPYPSRMRPGEDKVTVQILDGFDEWYGSYKAKRETSTPNMLLATGKKLVPQPQITYCITFTKGREILLNDSYQIAMPDFDRENEQVFNYLYNHPIKKFTRKQIETELRTSLVKSFHKIVENLGFTGALKKAFFSVSKDAIQFRNSVGSEDLAASVVEELNSLIAKD